MFDHVGKKIKAITQAVAYIGIGASVILGIWLCTLGSELILAGLLIMIIGSCISWLMALLSYAFGQIVDNTDRLVELAERAGKKGTTTPATMARSTSVVYQAPTPVQQNPVQQNPVQTVRAASNVRGPACIYCPKCGTKQRADRKLCLECGAPFLEQ